MLQAIWTILLFAIPTMFIAWIFRNLMEYAGVPGALVGINTSSPFRRYLAIILCSFGQTYVALVFTAFLVSFVVIRAHVSGTTVWPLWIAAFIFAFQPTAMCQTDANRERRETIQELGHPPSSIAYSALGLTCFLAPIGFFVFAFFPKLMYPLWAWVPYVKIATSY